MACRGPVKDRSAVGSSGDRRAAVYAAGRFGNGKVGSTDLLCDTMCICCVSGFCKTCMLCTNVQIEGSLPPDPADWRRACDILWLVESSTLGKSTDLCPQLENYLPGTRRHEARVCQSVSVLQTFPCEHPISWERIALSAVT